MTIPAASPEVSLVRDPQRLLEPVDERDRDGGHPIGVARPLVAERRVERLGARHVAADLEPRRQNSSSSGGRSAAAPRSTSSEVEAVADAEPVEARLGDRERLLRDGGRVDVEHAAALGVGERADAVLGREARELGRARAAAAEDDERDERGHRHERAGALAVGRADEPDGARREPGALERRAQHVVDERGDRAERGAAGAQHGRVQALQQLPATSSATFGRASKFAPTVPIGIRRSLHAQAVRRASASRSRARAARARRSPRPGRRVLRARASSRRRRSSVPSSSVPGGRLDVGGVRGEHSSAPLAEQGGGFASAPRRRRRRAGAGAAARAARSLVFDLLAHRRFIVCIVASASGRSPLTSREAEGTGPVTPRQPAPQAARCQTRQGQYGLEGCRARGKESSVVRYRTSLPQLRDRPRPRGGRCLFSLLGAARSDLRP